MWWLHRQLNIRTDVRAVQPAMLPRWPAVCPRQCSPHVHLLGQHSCPDVHQNPLMCAPKCPAMRFVDTQIRRSMLDGCLDFQVRRAQHEPAILSKGVPHANAGHGPYAKRWHTSSSLSSWRVEYCRRPLRSGELTGGSFQLIRLLASENWSTEATHLPQHSKVS